MTTRRVFVHLGDGSSSGAVGQLWLRSRQRRESASFLYDEDWLRHPGRFALEPGLDLRPGAFHTGPGLPVFGVFSDAAPDRWGRELLRRDEARRAAEAGVTPQALTEADFLLRSDDGTRQGAVRFREGPGAGSGPGSGSGSGSGSASRSGSGFLARFGGSRVPPVGELPRLLDAARRVDSGADEDCAGLRVLLAPGSALGGARPKASVRERDGSLALSKFPRERDEWEVPRWEAVALSLAVRAGVGAAKSRIEEPAGRGVLILRRFDRDSGRRIPFVSALTMLDAADHEQRPYTDIAEAIRRHGADPLKDLEELWRRIVFTVLISNHDDHLRNHGFLRAPGGWRLSPAYDLNPTPADADGRYLTTAIRAGDPRAALGTALETAGYYGLDGRRAREIAGEVAAAVGGWREEAARFGVPRRERERLASAFEHGERREAAAVRATG